MIALLVALGVLVSAAAEREVRVRPPPTLRKFHRSNAFVRAIVGPIGSGKSSACVIELFRRAAEQAPSKDGVRRTRFAVIRNTRPQLQDTTRKTFEDWVWRLGGSGEWVEEQGEWGERDFDFRLRLGQGEGRVESEILFRALDRPKDVRKVLSLELTGAYINEAREIAKEVFDGLHGRVGRFPSQAEGGASWFGVWMDTNPWHTAHWGYRLFSSKERPEGFELFEQPDGLSAQAENVEHLVPGYYPRLIHGKDAEWVDEYIRAKYPSADKGSVYGELLVALEARGGVSAFAHPKDGVYVSLDLGVSDATSVWWWRLNEHGVPDFVDWYEATGKGMSHYFEVIDGRGWQVRKVFLPHDARARSWQTGVSTLEQFLTHYGSGRVAITPELALEDGLAAARWLLEQPIRFHERTKTGVERLRAYRYIWDEERKVFSKKPMHDFSSHSADGFRYVACAARPIWEMTRPTEKHAPARVRSVSEYTMDELWELEQSASKRSRV